jgi:hypothetical protein
LQYLNSVNQTSPWAFWPALTGSWLTFLVSSSDNSCVISPFISSILFARPEQSVCNSVVCVIDDAAFAMLPVSLLLRLLGLSHASIPRQLDFTPFVINGLKSNGMIGIFLLETVSLYVHFQGYGISLFPLINSATEDNPVNSASLPAAFGKAVELTGPIQSLNCRL